MMNKRSTTFTGQDLDLPGSNWLNRTSTLNVSNQSNAPAVTNNVQNQTINTTSPVNNTTPQNSNLLSGGLGGLQTMFQSPQGFAMLAGAMPQITEPILRFGGMPALMSMFGMFTNNQNYNRVFDSNTPDRYLPQNTNTTLQTTNNEQQDDKVAFVKKYLIKKAESFCKEAEFFSKKAEDNYGINVHLRNMNNNVPDYGTNIHLRNLVNNQTPNTYSQNLVPQIQQPTQPIQPQTPSVNPEFPQGVDPAANFRLTTGSALLNRVGQGGLHAGIQTGLVNRFGTQGINEGLSNIGMRHLVNSGLSHGASNRLGSYAGPGIGTIIDSGIDLVNAAGVNRLGPVQLSADRELNAWEVPVTNEQGIEQRNPDGSLMHQPGFNPNAFGWDYNRFNTRTTPNGYILGGPGSQFGPGARFGNPLLDEPLSYGTSALNAYTNPLISASSLGSFAAIENNPILDTPGLSNALGLNQQTPHNTIQLALENAIIPNENIPIYQHGSADHNREATIWRNQNRYHPVYNPQGELGRPRTTWENLVDNATDLSRNVSQGVESVVPGARWLDQTMRPLIGR